MGKKKEKHESSSKHDIELDIGRSIMDINAIRQAVVSDDFEDNKGEKALVLLGQYPFLIIGNIKEVVSDYVFIRADFTHVAALDGFLYRIHIDDIEVYFIETAKHKIPEMDVFREEG